jgi:outer membrane protein OmpA-like peptidoglycan-associated protein
MTRSALAAIGLLASAAIPMTAQAQTESPTVSDYLCQFANRCDGEVAQATDESDPSRRAPETAGFRLATSGNQASSRTGNAAPQTQARTSNSALTESRASQRRAAPAVAGARADLVISFDLNSSQLTAEGRRNALVFAQALATPELSGKRFMIAGHTDSLGSNASNLELSRRRAEAVADLLISQGIDRSRLEVTGYGEARPLSGRRASDPANRRVEAILR